MQRSLCFYMKTQFYNTHLFYILVQNLFKIYCSGLIYYGTITVLHVSG